MSEHQLKTWPESWEAIHNGAKTVEVRFDDRGYEEGDTLVLREYQPAPPGADYRGLYTGRETTVTVTHVLCGIEWGLRPKYVALSIRQHTTLRAGGSGHHEGN